MSEMPEVIYIHSVMTKDGEPYKGVWTVEKKREGKYIRANKAQQATYNAMDSVAADFEQAAPQLSGADAQILELVHLVQSEGVSRLRVDFARSGLITCLVLDNMDGYYSIGDAIDDLERIRNERTKPAKPTAAEWYEAATDCNDYLSFGLDALIKRHEAAEEWERVHNDE